MAHSGGGGGGGHPPASSRGGRDPDSTSIDLGLDIQDMVAQRLATQSKKTVHLNELLRVTKFTKEEIRTMYRGFKQVHMHFHSALHTQREEVSSRLHFRC